MLYFTPSFFVVQDVSGVTIVNFIAAVGPQLEILRMVLLGVFLWFFPKA
jgi:hypothetical protein